MQLHKTCSISTPKQQHILINTPFRHRQLSSGGRQHVFVLDPDDAALNNGFRCGHSALYLWPTCATAVRNTLKNGQFETRVRIAQFAMSCLLNNWFCNATWPGWMWQWKFRNPFGRPWASITSLVIRWPGLVFRLSECDQTQHTIVVYFNCFIGNLWYVFIWCCYT